MTEEKNSTVLETFSNPEKNIPKYCTGVHFGIVRGQLVMSFVYKEGDAPANLIERVIIDMQHAEEISKILNEIVVDRKKNEKHK